MKRKDMKKATGILRSIELEDIFEEAIMRMKPEGSKDIQMYVAFTAPRFEDGLISKEDLMGDENK